METQIEPSTSHEVLTDENIISEVDENQPQEYKARPEEIYRKDTADFSTTDDSISDAKKEVQHI
jgi:hypothetical protein